MSSTSSELYKALHYSITEFDKNVLFIASGALGISMAFIDKVVQLPQAVNKGLLLTSWYILGGTIFISLLAHFISIMALRWAIKHNPPDDCSEEVLARYQNEANKRNFFIRFLNFMMMLSLLLGIIFLIAFIQTNL